MLKQRKGLGATALAIVLVSAIIGLVIVNGISTSGVYGDRVPVTGNETFGTANGSGYLAATLNVAPIVAASEVIYCNITQTTNYTLNDATGSLVVLNGTAGCINATVVGSYQDSAQRLTQSISRTIVQYIVPIALLGVLAITAAA